MNDFYRKEIFETTRTALITGASRGFGLLTTVTLARRGWHVLATMRDLNRRDRLESAARAAGVLEQIEFHTLDVTDLQQISVLASQVEKRPSPLHAIVNNAGFALPGFAEDVTDGELRRQLDTNFFGAAAVTRAFLPQLRRQRFGHVAMISSISGRIAFPGLGSYAASKFALEGWSEALRLEMKPLGIHVVLVEPGSFRTEIRDRNVGLPAGLLDPLSPNAARATRWHSRVHGDTRRADPQVVADKIASILANPRPRPRYIVGKDAALGLVLRLLLPWRLLERLIIKGTGMDQ